MRFWLILLFSYVLCACQRQNSTVEHSPISIDTPPIHLSELSEGDRRNLRIWLDSFYDGDKQVWQTSKRKILGLGSVGEEALSIFMVKFFFGSSKNTPFSGNDEELNLYWNRAREELVQLGEPAIPYIISAMAHPKMGTSGRLQCSMTLVQIGLPSVDPLVKNLEKGSRAFRRSAIETLANIGDPQVVPHIAQIYLQSPQGAIGSDIMDDPSFDIRYYSIKALGKLESPEGFPALEKALEDVQPNIVALALQTLLVCEEPEVIPILQQAMVISNQGKFIGYTPRIQQRISLLKTRL